MSIINEIEFIIFDLVCDFFKKSNDYNGIPSYNLNLPYTEEQLVCSIISLIDKDKISILTSEDDENYYIIRFGFKSKMEQIEFLINNGLRVDFCLYPSNNYLSLENINKKDKDYPFKHLLRLGHPQLKMIYFEWDILHKYHSDPRYNFNFYDYQGSIISTEQIKKEQNIILNSFGVGRDENNNYVVAVFLKDLANQPSNIQIEWEHKLINNQEKCNITEYYIRNHLHYCWNFPNTIYSSIIQEITNINLLTKEIYQESFFLHEYENERPIDFNMIYIPTKKAYLNYILEFEKIVINNINIKFLKRNNVNTRNQEGEALGSIALLSTFIKEIKPEIEQQIIQPLKKLRKLRQTPAHKIEKDIYDQKYFDKQHNITVEVFESLNLLRKVLQLNPKVVNYEIKYKQTENFIII